MSPSSMVSELGEPGSCSKGDENGLILAGDVGGLFKGEDIGDLAGVDATEDFTGDDNGLPCSIILASSGVVTI